MISGFADAHFLQRKKAPEYFFTVAGALLCKARAGRAAANSFNSGSLTTSSSPHAPWVNASERMKHPKYYKNITKLAIYNH